eukprot:6190594-Pleurochrysis_carterae.AAC.4
MITGDSRRPSHEEAVLSESARTRGSGRSHKRIREVASAVRVRALVQLGREASRARRILTCAESRRVRRAIVGQEAAPPQGRRCRRRRPRSTRRRTARSRRLRAAAPRAGRTCPTLRDRTQHKIQIRAKLRARLVAVVPSVGGDVAPARGGAADVADCERVPWRRGALGAPRKGAEDAARVRRVRTEKREVGGEQLGVAAEPERADGGAEREGEADEDEQVDTRKRRRALERHQEEHEERARRDGDAVGRRVLLLVEKGGGDRLREGHCVERDVHAVGEPEEEARRPAKRGAQ